MNWGYWGSVGIVSSEEYRERMSRAGIGSIEPPEAMEALETLLSSPLDQLVFMKTTRPLVMEGVSPGEVVAEYPQSLRPTIQNFQVHLPEQGAQVQRLKTERALLNNER
jgi:polyketide synthase PksN